MRCFFQPLQKLVVASQRYARDRLLLRLLQPKGMSAIVPHSDVAKAAVGDRNAGAMLTPMVVAQGKPEAPIGWPAEATAAKWICVSVDHLRLKSVHCMDFNFAMCFCTFRSWRGIGKPVAQHLPAAR